MVALVALVVLGPDKLPGAIRQAGRYWAEFQKLKGQLDSQMREVVGDLPVQVMGASRALRNPVRNYTEELLRPSSPPQSAPRARTRAPAGQGPPGRARSSTYAQDWVRPGRLVPFPSELEPGYDDPICN